MNNILKPDMKLEKKFCGSIVENFFNNIDLPKCILYKGNYLSFSMVNKYSNMLANYITCNYKGGKNTIAIYAYRNPNLVISLLAIIKAGFAFYIIDPRYPVSRTIACLRYIKPSGLINLEDSVQVPDEILFELKRLNGVSHISLPKFYENDCSENLILSYPDDFPYIKEDYNDMLYVSFTSGTTGVPKSIMGSVGPVSHFIHWQQTTFDINSSNSVSLLSGLAHDPLLRDILMPLWVGCCICIPTIDCFEYPGRLFKWFYDNEITITHITPSMVNFLLNIPIDYLSLKLPKLKYVFIGGEILTWKLVDRINSIAPNANIINCYGATETPQVMSYHTISPQADKINNYSVNTSPYVPIGKAISNCQLLILNSDNKLCGTNEEGLIYVRTPHRALKVSKPDSVNDYPYIINPYTCNEDDLLYKTGDYGYYLSDGSVICIGRKDRQVKIRGFRVELDEINNILVKDKRIAAHYIDVEEVNNSNSLIVYAIPNKDSDINKSTIKSIIASELPFYMIPDNCHIIPYIPLTPNGKTDKYALKNLINKSNPTFDQINNIEHNKVLIQLRSILNFPDLGWNDDLTSIGIDSIRAVEISCAIQNIINRELNISDIYKYKTLSSIYDFLVNEPHCIDKPIIDLGKDQIPNDTIRDILGKDTKDSLTSADQKHSNRVDKIKLLPPNERLITAILNRFYQIIARIAPDAWRNKLHRMRGVNIGQNVSIGYDTIIETAYPWLVHIGNNVNIGMRVTIIGHFRGMGNIHKGFVSVKLCDYAFIGPGVIILPNVTIGEGSVIAAGSVVSSNIPSLTLAQGNPAKVIAKCRLPLSGSISYKEFISALKPI